MSGSGNAALWSSPFTGQVSGINGQAVCHPPRCHEYEVRYLARYFSCPSWQGRLCAASSLQQSTVNDPYLKLPDFLTLGGLVTSVSSLSGHA
jgi:hypothetical protein